MIKKIFHTSTNSVVSAAVIVAALSLLSRVVGFIRDRVLAGLFGAGDQLDVYYSSLKVPDFIFQLLVVGALSASFIPIFTKYFGKDNQAAWSYTNKLLNSLLLTFILLAIVGIFAAPIYIPWLVPGFDGVKQLQVIQSARILFLGQVFFVFSMVYGSVLQSAKRFALYSLAPIVNNLGILFGAMFFVPIVGITGLAWGAVLGAVTHGLVQVVGVYALGYRYQLIFNPFDKDVMKTVSQTLPRILGLAASQVNFLILTGVASLLAIGSVTILQFAYNLNFFPIGVVGVSYAIAAFPTFCELAHDHDHEKLKQALSSTIRQVLFFIVPATFLFLLLRAQIVRLVFGAGAFDWSATIQTAETLAVLAISFFAQSLVYVVVRVYFALTDAWTPFFAGLTSTVISLAVGLGLAPNLGVPGLAVGISVAAMIQLCLLWLGLKYKLGHLHEGQILYSVAILSAAGLVGAGVTQLTKYVVVNFTQLDSFSGVFIQTLAASLTGLASYLLMTYLLKSPEFLQFSSGIKARLLRSVKPTEVVPEV
jgi:putative peptidoglycan lipid II flippase